MDTQLREIFLFFFLGRKRLQSSSTRERLPSPVFIIEEHPGHKVFIIHIHNLLRVPIYVYTHIYIHTHICIHIHINAAS